MDSVLADFLQEVEKEATQPMNWRITTNKTKTPLSYEYGWGLKRRPKILFTAPISRRLSKLYEDGSKVVS